MDIRMKEIRRILSGYYGLNEENYITVGEGMGDMQGLSSSSLGSGLFGLKTVTRQYHSEADGGRITKVCVTALRKLGRRTYLSSAPDAYVTFKTGAFWNPFILTAEIDGPDMLVVFYTAKAIFARLHAKRILKKFEKYCAELELENREITMIPEIDEPVQEAETEDTDEAENAAASEENGNEKP